MLVIASPLYLSLRAEGVAIPVGGHEIAQPHLRIL